MENLDAFNTPLAAFRHQVARFPDKPALVFLGPQGETDRLSYARLDRAARCSALALERAGLMPGELVILALDHEPALVSAFFGALYAGVAPAVFPYLDPASPREAWRDRLCHHARSVEARAVLARPDVRDELAERFRDGGCAVVSPPPEPGVGEGSADAGPAPEPDPRSLCYVQFSSGTTGMPKGVMLSHAAALQQVRAIQAYGEATSADVNVGWLPFFHDMGLAMHLLLPVLTGGTCVTIPPGVWVRRPWLLLQAVHRYRGSIGQMPNFAFQHCLKHVDDRHLEGADLSSLRVLVNGAEPIQAEVMDCFTERFSPWGFSRNVLCMGYGMAEYFFVASTTPRKPWVTETVSLASLRPGRGVEAVPPGTPGSRTLVSCGPLSIGTEVRVLDDDGNPLPNRCTGEIAVRGPCLFSGYLRLPEETAAVLRDGWFRTGDIGYVSEGGLFICDRKKDLIIAGGHNVYPLHVEEAAGFVLGDHLREAAAFGVTDPDLGTETAVLVCVLRPGLTEAELAERFAAVRRRVRQELDIALTDILSVRSNWVSRTTSGKVSRRGCRERYLRERAGEKPPGGRAAAAEGGWRSREDAERELGAVFARSLGRESVPRDADLFALGVTSLEAVRRILKWEDAAGRRIDVEAWVAEPTVARLAALLCGLPPARPAAGSEPGPQPRRPASRRTPGPSVSPGAVSPVRREPPPPRFPYGLGSRLQRLWLSSAVVRRAAFAGPVSVLERWLRERGTPGDRATVILNLMVNTWVHWRVRSLIRPDNAAHWISVTGAEQLRAVAQEGRGQVVVGQHYPLMGLLRWYNQAFHGGAFRFFHPQRHGMEQRERGRTLEVYAAQRHLEAGKPLWIMGDGLGGKEQVRVPFHGHGRAFRPGPAELAVRTGAAFIPVFVGMDLAGRVRIEFAPDLAAVPPGGDDPVRALLVRYADLLAGRWAADLPNLKWKHLARYLEQPLDDGDEEED
ncbi:MAG: AMP-binding protein [Acidobacteria bacterium]|nr:AMP-binding protein [Acidobacteriota bacterium]